MKPTELRKNIYKILDRIAETGKPVQIERNGEVFKIICESKKGKLDRLKQKNHPKAFIGNSDEILSMDWTAEWKPKHI
jgi:PHD/YefM family antitoxin component YafN of YafNO toxin-antitoxin module